MRDALEVRHEEPCGVELATAQIAAPDMRLERCSLEADLAVQQLVDLVRKKVSFHGYLYGLRMKRVSDGDSGYVRRPERASLSS